MMGKLSGKTALVTGAGRGIGRGIAKRLAADGAKVAINYSRAAAQAEDLAAEIKAAGGEAITVACDISDPAQVAAMFEQVKQAFGWLDILVNNAGRGTAGGAGTLADISIEDFDAIFALNTRGTFLVTKAALPLLRDGGRVINISSTTTRVRMPGLGIYAGSKSAVEAFTRGWAVELAPRQITVNSVVPGIVDTDLIGHMSDERKASSVAAVPLGRIGKPEDIADVVAFLASDDSRWVTSHEIVASGGN